MSAGSVKTRPVPKATLTTKPFWDAVNQGRLLLQYDVGAGCYQFWPRSTGAKSGSPNLQWREASGKGKLYSFTVTHVAVEGFEDRAPYVIGLVELDEGVRIVANLAGVTPDEVRIGMALRVTFENMPDGSKYYAFEPDR